MSHHQHPGDRADHDGGIDRDERAGSGDRHERAAAVVAGVLAQLEELFHVERRCPEREGFRVFSRFTTFIP